MYRSVRGGPRMPTTSAPSNTLATPASQSETRTRTRTRAGAGAEHPGLPEPTTLAVSQEIRDRGSAFVGYLYRAQTGDDARGALLYHHQHVHAQHARAGTNREEKVNTDREVYAIAAWRCMVVKPGRTGLGGPDEFVVEEGCEDGGERWAGKKVLGVMQREGSMDALVIVSRWFGGTLLGPARFAHIETCAGEVCRRFKKVEEMEECIQTLKTLDDLLAVLRAQWAVTLEQAKTKNPSSCPTGPENSGAKGKPPDYRTMQEGLDLTKARRLVHARECAIKNTKILIEKYKISM